MLTFFLAIDRTRVLERARQPIATGVAHDSTAVLPKPATRDATQFTFSLWSL